MKKTKASPSSSSSQSKFANVPRVDIKRSRLDRSHGLKTSFGRDEWDTTNSLIPVYWDEVLPGDSFHMKSTGFIRLATPLHPVMDNLFIDVHYFFVPNRLCWSNWQKFMGERVDPADNPNDFTVPVVQVTAGTDSPQASPNRLNFCFGLPMNGDSSAGSPHNVNALPFRAYRLIWNEWYRDQNLQDSVAVATDDGPDPTSYGVELLPRGKQKDYFTSALPWPQKGDPVVIPVELEGTYANAPDLDVWGKYGVSGPFPPSGTSVDTTGFGDNWSPNFLQADGDGIELGVRSEYIQNTTTINDLRTAFQIQKLLERDARGGTRYIELIKSHFGVTSDDARLQRPEYLGGGSSRVNINPVPNMTGTVDAPQGNLAGFGTSVNTATFSKSFTEHGFIIGLASYRADLTYQRGVERMWSRRTRYDYFWPVLQGLGEQAILNKEINFRGGEHADDEVFGYQERYGEYRYKPSRITGLFNSDAAGSLDAWHLAQDFPVDADVVLNADFIHQDPPLDRILAVPDEAYFLADFWFDLKCDRPMSAYPVPGLVDHF